MKDQFDEKTEDAFKKIFGMNVVENKSMKSGDIVFIGHNQLSMNSEQNFKVNKPESFAVIKGE